MKALKEFNIPFVGLKVGEHRFEYEIEQSFFDHFEYTEFNDSRLQVYVILNKKTTLLELNFKISGFHNLRTAHTRTHKQV